MANTLLLMMGGIGSRFGNSLPKQFTEVCDKPVFLHILERYSHIDYIDNIVLVVNPLWIDLTKKITKNFSTTKRFEIIPGGGTRSESIKNGLIFIRKYSEGLDNILIHDATHPYVDIETISKAISKMDFVDGVTLCQRQYDTCYIIDEHDNVVAVQPKANIISGASPEIFHYKNLYDIYLNASKSELEEMTSAGAIALKYNLKMVAISSPYLNLKITYPEDMILFRFLCNSYYFPGDTSE